MLLLRAKTATINNITFFADDSDDNQFWYLPGDIHIAQKSGEPVFSLLKYTGDASDPQGIHQLRGQYGDRRSGVEPCLQRLSAQTER